MTGNNTGAASVDLGVMEGKGFYNRHSGPQRGAVAFGLPLLEHAVGAVSLPDSGGVLQVADYGVAGGNNSMEPMRTIIDGARRRSSEDLAVSVVHTDLPTNDFDELFTLLASPDSHLQGRPAAPLPPRGQIVLRAALPRRRGAGRPAPDD